MPPDFCASAGGATSSSAAAANTLRIPGCPIAPSTSACFRPQTMAANSSATGA
jgi:hypothetical protein